MMLKQALLSLLCVFCLLSCGGDEAGLKINGHLIEPKAQLQGLNFSNADLQDANLQEANLQRTVLNFANLDRANLQNADLSFASLRGASLVDANLAFANLRLADLSGANLRSAQLQRTDLRSANLLDTTFDRTNFQGAVFNIQTKFPNSFNPSTHGLIFDDLPLPPASSDNNPPEILQSNKVLSLDGNNDFVEIPDSDSLSFPGDVTLEAWVSPRKLSAKQRILSKWGPIPRSNTEYSLDIFSPDVRFVVAGRVQIPCKL